MRLLIAGGAGFIGSNFARRIIDGTLKGIKHITVLDKLTYAGTLENLKSIPVQDYEFIQGDICDEQLAQTLAQRHDAIINFAAESHVDRSILKSRDFVVTNVLGVQTLLEAARIAEVETFIQVSTDEVYGSVSTGSSTELSSLRPNSPYAASKASADLIARSFFHTYGTDIRITRCTNNYGPNQFPEKLIPLFITNLIDGHHVPVYGNGLNVRDWLHVDDHCQGIYLTLMKGRAGEIYNIGGNNTISNLDLTLRILSLMNANDSSIDYTKDRPGHDFRYSLDYTKIADELGYSPKIALENGLQNTIKWYRKNETWWRPLKSA